MPPLRKAASGRSIPTSEVQETRQIERPLSTPPTTAALTPSNIPSYYQPQSTPGDVPSYYLKTPTNLRPPSPAALRAESSTSISEKLISRANSPNRAAAATLSAPMGTSESQRAMQSLQPTASATHSFEPSLKDHAVSVRTTPPPPLPPQRQPGVPVPPMNMLPSANDSTSSQDSYVSVDGGILPKTTHSSNMFRNHSANALHVPATYPTPQRERINPSIMGVLTPSKSSTALKAQTPMTLSDLGKDYSRYPLRSNRDSYAGTGTSTPALLYSRTGTATPSGVPLLSDQSQRNPFTDSLVNIANGTDERDPEKFTPFLDDRIGAPSTADGYNFPMYLDEKELDDDMHMPYPDDDVKLKPKFRDYLAPRQLCSIFGLLFLTVGILCIFVLLPVLTAAGVSVYSYSYETPYNQMVPQSNPSDWNYVNAVKYPLLRNIRTGLIDPTTPDSAKTRKSVRGDDLQLVFSDEFNGHNRTFYPGDDPYWTAPDLWYGATQDLEWYDPDAVTTDGGTLIFQLDKFLNHNLNYRSGMLNSWNQICFKGGALEVSVSLAGPGGVPGLWPGAWTMGNLGRPGYGATTEGIWPYTYNDCDAGITPNQSMSDGTNELPGQRLPSCVCPGQDHPTPGTGRGAPEIDVFEASADPNSRTGVVTQSYQVAPFDIWYRPNYDYMAINNYDFTQMNTYCGGPFQQAISGTTTLNNGWYDGKIYQKYAVEYTPGTGSSSNINWFVGEDMTYMMTGDAIGPNGNVKSRVISEEPMSIILNLGFSSSWTYIDLVNLKFPTLMRVDYVRWYQKADNSGSVTCDPQGYETTQYIKDHPKAYNNPNLTRWDETGYPWPKHKLNSRC